MAVVEVRGVPTQLGRQLIRDTFIGVLPGGVLASALAFGYFRVGEKGYVTQPGGVQIPNSPDNTELGYTTQTNILATVPLASAVNTDFGNRYFQKSFSGGNLTVNGTFGLNIACILLLTEANGQSLIPVQANLQLFEIGVFIPGIPGYNGGSDIMFAYATYPKETKTPSIAMTHNVNINF